MMFREKYKAEQAFSVPPELLVKTAAAMREPERTSASKAPGPFVKGLREVRPHFSYKTTIGLAAAFLLVLAGAGYYNLWLKGGNSADILNKSAQDTAFYDETAEEKSTASKFLSTIQNDLVDGIADDSVGTITMPGLLAFVSAFEEEPAFDSFWVEEIDDAALFKTVQTVTELPVYQNDDAALQEEIAAGTDRTATEEMRRDPAWLAAVQSGLIASKDDETASGWTSTTLREIGVYPLRTAQEARRDLLEGEYITAVPESYEVELTDAAIKGVELTYYGSDTLKLIQPSYVFYIEVDAGMVRPESAAGEKIYLRYWVPAVKSEYVQIVK